MQLSRIRLTDYGVRTIPLIDEDFLLDATFGVNTFEVLDDRGAFFILSIKDNVRHNNRIIQLPKKSVRSLGY